MTFTLAELRYGAEARRSCKLHRLIGTFVEPIEGMSFDQSAAWRFAGIALTFVTNNTQHFRRVPGLITKNWV